MWLIALWGIAGVLLLLGQAIARLTPLALEPVLDGSLGPLEWSLYGGWVALNAYAEGYRGFQKGFAPRVVARALHVGRHRQPLRVILAPLFCMGLFGATRRRLIASWAILLMVVVLVTMMRFVPQPWRGIVDGGVVVGLVWGGAAIAAFTIAALSGREPAASPDVPGP